MAIAEDAVPGSENAASGSSVSALANLAARCGIEPQFQDARGQIKVASDATKRSLLAAMGIVVIDERSAAKALDELEAREWRTPMSPVTVHIHGLAPQVPISLPSGTTSVSWRITFEADAEPLRSALQTMRFSELPLIDARRIDGISYERRRLPLPADLPMGYHRLRLETGGIDADLIVAPRACWLPPAVVAGRGLWGMSVQMYLLRSARQWGIGDYTDLARLAEILAKNGADVIGLNPLHAMFLDEPEHASPYSPASRLLLNVLNIDIEGLPEFASCDVAARLLSRPDFQRRLREAREAALVDYTRVAKLKIDALRALFDCCCNAGAFPREQELTRFRSDSGKVLERHATFLALREYFAESDPKQADWRRWPESFQKVDSEALEGFMREQAHRITFHVWLQFLADAQLAHVAAATGSMAIGLYRDLAVGADPAGAETWANPHAVAGGAQVGAPPDIYNPAGQDWGLPPFNPRALVDERYRSFIELIRANMRHAGGLRIDHVMALKQLYWVPTGEAPSEGAYVRYPLDDLIGILALESHRHQCLVVGEDLGTVPAGFRERMAEAQILSYRVVQFERNDEGFIAAQQYPRLALAVAGSHDLPTQRGWWEGRDIELKKALNLYPQPQDVQLAREERKRDHEQLQSTLRAAGQIPPSMPGAQDLDLSPQQLNLAVHAFLASTTAAIVVVQIDDVANESEPVNVPATSDQHPNWRRRISLPLENMAQDGTFRAFVEMMNEARPR